MIGPDGTDRIVVAILAYFFSQFPHRKIALLEIYRVPEAATGGLFVTLVSAS